MLKFVWAPIRTKETEPKEQRVPVYRSLTDRALEEHFEVQDQPVFLNKVQEYIQLVHHDPTGKRRMVGILFVSHHQESAERFGTLLGQLADSYALAPYVLSGGRLSTFEPLKPESLSSTEKAELKTVAKVALHLIYVLDFRYAYERQRVLDILLSRYYLDENGKKQYLLSNFCIVTQQDASLETFRHDAGIHREARLFFMNAQPCLKQR